MPQFTRKLCALLAVALLPGAAGAETVTASDLPLAGAVESAMSRQAGDSETTPFTASAWLAALPSIDASYLQSQERLGTDETEIGLNLPIKSPFLYQQDSQLRELADGLSATEAERRRLYFSGLVREAVWTARIAGYRAQQAQKKIDLLEQLRAREQSLFDARGSTRYALLLVRQELVDARIELEDQRAQAQRWRARFRQVSGLGSIPAQIDEGPAPAGEAWQGHPALRLLDLGWEQQRALIAAGSSRAAPWNLRLGAKRVETQAYSEDQYGVAIEVPLGFLGSDSQSSTSEWRNAARLYYRDRDELQQELAQTWQRLQLEAAYLQRRQSLLDESADISGELRSEAQALSQLNEMGSEIRIKRMIADLDRQSEAAVNQLLIGQNRAMSRQAAGIPL